MLDLWLQYFCIGFFMTCLSNVSFSALRNNHSTAEMTLLLHPTRETPSSSLPDVFTFMDVRKAKVQILSFYELWLQPYKLEFTKDPQTSVYSQQYLVRFSSKSEIFYLCHYYLLEFLDKNNESKYFKSPSTFVWGLSGFFSHRLTLQNKK